MDDLLQEFGEFLDEELLIGNISETSVDGDPVRAFEPLYSIKGAVQKRLRAREVELGGNTRVLVTHTIYVPMIDLDYKKVVLTEEMIITRDLWFALDKNSEYFKILSVNSPLGSHWSVETRVIRNV